MKKTTPTKTSSPLKIYCDIFGHNYEMTKKVTSHVKEYTCKCCKRQLTTNGNGKLTELTPKYKEINAILEQIYTRRMMRLKKKTLSSSIY
ncbi:hypothetical protein [Psychroserpens luteolus]|uniref:hypothetical protein n=1 Tax=Psychroserpens luteolus TaxID=2855840 RepID=UPI001E2B3D35|nr:hypothetical protein [Psychroserpens luteolus]MCD2258439.1 hypothetical protein [Psychroserpens luteolus]